MNRFLIEEDDQFEIYFNKNGIKKAFKKSIKKPLKKFGHASALYSEINMVKQNCIPKEKYERMYKTNEESEKREDLSVGEELETFIGNLKMGKFPTREDYKPSFLLCLHDTVSLIQKKEENWKKKMKIS